MDDLRLALRGLWFRRGVSLGVLLVAALVVGGAVTGPLFLRAASESVLRDTLTQGLSSGRIVADRVKAPLAADPLAQVRQQSAARLSQRPTLDRLLGQPVAALQTNTAAGLPGATRESVTVAYRDDLCAHVRMIEGRCLDRSGTVLVSAATAEIEGWRAGRPLRLGSRSATVSGTYVPLDPTGDYWAGRPYFAAYTGSGDATHTDSASSLDTVFASLPTVQIQDGDGIGSLDRPLDTAGIRLTDLPALQAELESYLTEDTNGFATDEQASAVGVDIGDSAIPALLTQTHGINDKLTLPVVIVEAQLLVLAWLVLFLVVANAAEARGPEVALAKLRGVPAGSTVAFGLADTLLLVLLAVPVGFGLARLGVGAITALQLAPGTPVVITATAGYAAAAAGAGAVVAAVLAASATLRRPVVEQWRRATRKAKGRPWVLDVIVAGVAVAGLVVLVRAGAIDAAAPSPLALAAPGLVVLAAALVGSRLLLAGCRAAYGPTRRHGWTGSLLAVRQLGRRPTTLRLALVLAVAFGLVTFAINAWAVARANAHDRAWTEIGAAQVLTVIPPAGQDLGAVVDRLDPSGRQAVAVSTATQYGSPPSLLLLAAQPDRFERVAFWRDDFAPAPLAALAAGLTVDTAAPVMLRGDTIEVGLDVERLTAPRPPVLVAEVVGASTIGGPTMVTLGPLHLGAQRLRAAVACGSRPCRLAGLHLQRPGGDPDPVRAQLSVTRLRTHAATGWQDVDAGLSTPGGWRTEESDTVRVAPAADGLVVTVTAGGFDVPGWQVADYPAAVPAVLTAPVVGRGGSIDGLGGRAMTLAPLAVAAALPGATDRGVLVDRDYARRAAFGSVTDTVETVWLTSSAIATFPAQLEAAGVVVIHTDSADRLAALYERQGPNLTILLYLAGAAVAAALAGGGVVLNLHLTGRRRTYELAAMAALGVRRRTLIAALGLEQGLLLVFGIAIGAAAGILGTVLALPAVPEFADDPTAPALRYGVHWLPVLGSLAVATVVLTATVALSSIALVRSARYDQLREAPA